MENPLWVKLASLWVMQEELRRPIGDLVKLIKCGMPVPSPIEIVEFEDGTRMVHNGHHRAVAALLAGRAELNPNEYVLSKRTYAGYMAPNMGIGFVTPFDPRIEVRIPDFRSLKCDILLAIAENRMDAASEMMSAREFVSPRTIKTVAELAAKVIPLEQKAEK